MLTSRNWEREQPDERYEVERGGRRALVTYAWAGNDVDIAVTVDGETVAERLTFWPFTHETLLADLRAVGLTLEREHLRARRRPLSRHCRRTRQCLKVRG